MESGSLFFGSNSSNYFRGTRMAFNMEESSKKRSFMSTLDDMMEEEYYDEQLSEKKRRLSPEQVHMLERSFEEENKLEPERKTELAKKLGLQPRQVAVWFQNRRARCKTKTIERDYNRLKSCYDILSADYESMAKENEKLKAEIVSLTEKLQSKEVSEASAAGQGSGSAGYVPEVLSENVKVTGSAVVIDDDDGPQLVESGDSYFPNDDDYPHEYVVVPVDHQSEEDDASDDGQLGWWVWS